MSETDNFVAFEQLLALLFDRSPTFNENDEPMLYLLPQVFEQGAGINGFIKNSMMMRTISKKKTAEFLMEKGC